MFTKIFCCCCRCRLLPISRTYDRFAKRWLIGDLSTHGKMIGGGGGSKVFGHCNGAFVIHLTSRILRITFPFSTVCASVRARVVVGFFCCCFCFCHSYRIIWRARDFLSLLPLIRCRNCDWLRCCCSLCLFALFIKARTHRHHHHTYTPTLANAEHRQIKFKLIDTQYKRQSFVFHCHSLCVLYA